MAGNRRRHRHPVSLPERGAPLDVGKEEGDGTGGKLGHGPLPGCGLSCSWPIVARREAEPLSGARLGRGSASTPRHNLASARIVRLRFSPDEGWEVAA